MRVLQRFREQRLAERAARTMAQATPRNAVMASVEKNSATPVRKDKPVRTSDLETFPACASRPGVVGCHQQLDQGALFDKVVRRVLEPVWAVDTRRRIKAMGCWPASIEYPK